jgi:hypothetical protein
MMMMNIHLSHQQVIRALIHPVKKVNDDDKFGETPFWTTALLSYISLITKCARIMVSQEVQGRKKMLYAAELWTDRKGAKNYCVMKPMHIPNKKKCSIVLYN